MSNPQITPTAVVVPVGPPPGLDVCAKCKFYADDGSGQQGGCRETAPGVAVWAMPMFSPVGYGPRAGWPLVLGSDWCGAWEQRPLPPTGLSYIWDGGTSKPASGSGDVRIQFTQSSPGTMWASVVGADGVDYTANWQAIKAGTIIRITDAQDPTTWLEYAAGGVPSTAGGIATLISPTYRNMGSALRVPSAVRILIT